MRRNLARRGSGSLERLISDDDSVGEEDALAGDGDTVHGAIAEYRVLAVTSIAVIVCPAVGQVQVEVARSGSR